MILLKMANELGFVVIHPFWVAACILHPGFRSLAFIHDLEKTRRLHDIVVGLIRIFLQTNVVVGEESRHQISVTLQVLGYNSFSLNDAMDFVNNSNDAPQDEMSSRRVRINPFHPPYVNWSEKIWERLVFGYGIRRSTQG